MYIGNSWLTFCIMCNVVVGRSKPVWRKPTNYSLWYQRPVPSSQRTSPFPYSPAPRCELHGIVKQRQHWSLLDQWPSAPAAAETARRRRCYGRRWSSLRFLCVDSQRAFKKFPSSNVPLPLNCCHGDDDATLKSLTTLGENCACVTSLQRIHPVPVLCQPTGLW